MCNKEKNNQSTDSHIPAIDLCLSGEGETTYQALGTGRIEVGGLVEMPFPITESNVDNARLSSLQFVWWFELFYETLHELSVYQEEFQFRFYSDNFLVYNIVLNSPSIKDAVEQIENIHNLVSEKLASKMKVADNNYDTWVLSKNS